MKFCLALAAFCFAMALLFASTLPAHGGFLLLWLAIIINLIVVGVTPHICEHTIPAIITMFLGAIAQLIFVGSLGQIGWSDTACGVLGLIETALFLASASQIDLVD